MTRLLGRALALAGVVSVLVALSSCVDETAIFDKRQLLDDPPTAAQSFLGYADRESRLTVCGSCHVQKQGQWEQTAHAHAWDALQNSGEAEASCEPCHTVNAYGNEVTGEAGWVSTQDDRYHDVQCESCHGPGLTHVLNPVDENAPLASVAVGVDLTNGCGECHQDVHQPFVEEWSASRHARLSSSLVRRPDCATCHSGNGALAAWGINAPFLEQLTGDPYPITCAVCHDPHGGPNVAQLRFPIDAVSVEGNLCMKCHQRLGNPDFAVASAGPHSPQGPLLLGTAGWWPPSFQWQRLVGTHGMPEANPKLCAACHVASYTVTDEATGEFIAQATGHIFSPIPCLDDQGRPTTDRNCDDSRRSFKACAASGCHTDEAEAVTARATANARLAALSSDLNELLKQVPSSEFSDTDNRYSIAEGAAFNRKLARGGAAVHNPFLAEALLIASIQVVQSTYGVSLPMNADLTPVFAVGDAVAGRHTPE